MNKKEYYFPSCTGEGEIYGCGYFPDGEYDYVLVINHGMAEQTKNDTTFRFVTDETIDEESN